MSYRKVNIMLAVVSLLLLAAPRALTLTPAGDGLLVPGGGRVPELCLRKRLTGMPSRSCNMGRSVVLASHGAFQASVARHPGGVLLWGWLAIHAVARFALALRPPRTEKWWLDLTFTAVSIFAVSLIVSFLRAPPGMV
jgi:hypothetical protein